MKAPKRLFASLLLAGGLAVATTAPVLAAHDSGKSCPMKQSGHAGKMGGMMGHGMMGQFEHLPPFLHGLDLTEEQRDKIFDITYAQVPALRKHHKDVQKLHAQRKELTFSKDYDSGKMKKLVDAETKLHAEHLLLMAETHNKIYQLLTDDQRKQLVERAEKHKGHH